MSDFNLAIPVIMAHEGTDTNYWVNDPNDLGGETVWGWSMYTIKNLGLKPADLGLNIPDFVTGCLKTVSKQKCQDLYKTYFWDKYGYGNINDQKIATKCMDAAVNMGPKEAGMFAQRAANSLGKTLTVDGQLGPQSYAAINACDPQALIKAYADQMTAYYNAIVTARPANAKFLRTWLLRAQWGV